MPFRNLLARVTGGQRSSDPPEHVQKFLDTCNETIEAINKAEAARESSIARHHGSRHHRSHRDEYDGPENAHTTYNYNIHHHHYPAHRDNREIERANYEEDRGDYYKAAYYHQRQQAEAYRHDRNEYGQRYLAERQQHQYDNRRAHHAQRNSYAQGYHHGTAEGSEHAARRRARQYEQARYDDQRRYEEYEQGYAHGGHQSRRSGQRAHRQSSPNNHARRLTYQDERGNDAAYRHGNQWHGYVESEYDD